MCSTHYSITADFGSLFALHKPNIFIEHLSIKEEEHLISFYALLVSVDQILRIISYELYEILLDINGNIKAECSALREIHNHFKATKKR
jgi:hypothetical protein